MITNRIITFILGIIMIICGVFCLFNPEMTYMTIGLVAGINMVIDAIGAIMLWIEIKRVYRQANIWALIAAIASAAFGVFLITNSQAQFVVDMTIIYMIAIWQIIIGVVGIVLSLKIRAERKELQTEYLGRNWWLILLTGVLLIACGIYGMINPAALINAAGVFLGLSIIVAGANIVSVVA
ncbi:MAG: DUF308 domain-containing protein [Erysipelotrichaceae bacterium]|nr:DUF308 domain-containing protein [Erysipelotrichaceae bacterium]